MACLGTTGLESGVIVLAREGGHCSALDVNTGTVCSAECAKSRLLACSLEPSPVVWTAGTSSVFNPLEGGPYSVILAPRVAAPGQLKVIFISLINNQEAAGPYPAEKGDGGRGPSVPAYYTSWDPGLCPLREEPGLQN